MPRVSAEYMQQRRDEIADAALRCFRANGFATTSIADIVAESGLSAGAIYTHFGNKAELAIAVAQRVLGGGVDARLLASARPEDGPRGVTRAVLTAIRDEQAPVEVILQVWGTAASDPVLRNELLSNVGRITDVVRGLLRSWLRDTGADDAEAEADRLTDGILSIAQGYIARSALFGPVDVDEFLDAQAGALAESAPSGTSS